MKCPLLRIPIGDIEGLSRDKADECIEAKCAWWDKGLEQCSVLALQQSIARMMGSLIAIAKELTLIRPPGK